MSARIAPARRTARIRAQRSVFPGDTLCRRKEPVTNGQKLIRELLGLFFIFCGLLILLSLSAPITSFAERIRRLTQTVAILEERIRRLEGESTPPSHET